MTLIKQVKDLYEKNFKSLKKEMEEDLRKWKNLPCSWISRINIVKMALAFHIIFQKRPDATECKSTAEIYIDTFL